MSYSTSLSDIQYTKDPEEARLEHEKELERLKEDCQVDSPPIENLQEVLKISSQDQLTNRNLDKTLEVRNFVLQTKCSSAVGSCAVSTLPIFGYIGVVSKGNCAIKN